MDHDNGNGTVVEPVVPGAPGAEGTEPTETGTPAENQSTGENTTKEGVKGAASPSWMAQLPNDLKVDPALQKYASLADFVRGSKTGGADGKEVVVDTANVETEPVKYENFAKKFSFDADPFGTLGDTLKGELEAARVPMDVAEKMFDSFSKAHADSLTQLVSTGKDWCEAQLKETWGDKYETKRNAMTRAYVNLVKVDSPLAKALDATGASINPAVAELLSTIGESISEDGSIGSNKTGGKGGSPRVPVKYPD